MKKITNNDDYEIKPIRIMLPKRSTYVKNYDGKYKWMSFLIKYDELLKKYNHVWNKVSNCIKKNLIENLPTEHHYSSNLNASRFSLHTVFTSLKLFLK